MFKRLMGYLKPMKSIFIVSVIALLVYGAVDATFIAFIQPFIDKGFSGVGMSGSVNMGTTSGFDSGNSVLFWAPFVVVGLFTDRKSVV